MSFSSTQNLNPTYDLLSATSIQTNDLVTNTFTATTFDATTIVATLVDCPTIETTTVNATGVITGATVNATNVNATGIITGVSLNGTTVNATTVVATTVDCTTCAPDSLSLIDAITSTNTKQPTSAQLGYLSVTSNGAQVDLATTVESVVVQTASIVPIGVYQVNARVQLSIGAGVTIDSLQIQINTDAGTISGSIDTNSVTYDNACQASFFQSVCFFNNTSQNISITVTATFAEGAVDVQTGNAKLSLVRIA